MEPSEEHVRELAGLYHRHFTAETYKAGSDALAEAEAFQRELVEAHGAEYARRVDSMAYAIGHG